MTVCKLRIGPCWLLKSLANSRSVSSDGDEGSCCGYSDGIDRNEGWGEEEKKDERSEWTAPNQAGHSHTDKQHHERVPRVFRLRRHLSLPPLQVCLSRVFLTHHPSLVVEDPGSCNGLQHTEFVVNNTVSMNVTGIVRVDSQRRQGILHLFIRILDRHGGHSGE